MSAALAHDKPRTLLDLSSFPSELIALVLQLATKDPILAADKRATLCAASLVDRTWRPQSQRLLFVEPVLASRADIQSWVLGQRRGRYRPVILEISAARKDSEQPFAQWDASAWKGEDDVREVLDVCGSSLRVFRIDWRHSMKLSILEHAALDAVSKLRVVWMDAPFSPLFEPSLEDIRLERLAPRYPLARPLPLTSLTITSSDPDQPCDLLLSALPTSLSTLTSLSLHLGGDSIDSIALAALITAAAPTLQRLSLRLSDTTYEAIYPSLRLCTSLVFFSQYLDTSSEGITFFYLLPPSVKNVELDGHDWETVVDALFPFCIELIGDYDKCVGVETIWVAERVLLEVNEMYDAEEEVFVAFGEERGIFFQTLKEGKGKVPRELDLSTD